MVGVNGRLNLIRRSGLYMFAFLSLGSELKSSTSVGGSRQSGGIHGRTDWAAKYESSN